MNLKAKLLRENGIVILLQLLKIRLVGHILDWRVLYFVGKSKLYFVEGTVNNKIWRDVLKNLP